MIFPKIDFDSLTQTNDGVRIDARKTIYRNLNEIEDIEISPDGVNFFSVFENGNFDKWFLDWSYDVAGAFPVTVRTTDTDTNVKTISREIEVILPEDDLFFSTDQDITQSEPEILRYLPNGKTSFTFMHRESARRILAYLDEQRLWKKDGTRYTKDDLFDKEEFVHWSRFLTLHLIFSGKIVSPGDFFESKAAEYRELYISARQRASIRLSPDGEEPAEMVKDRVVSFQFRR